ncbi:chromosome segregation protein SMC [Paramagnetospirillum kuznetsovii]|uniref:Chromosome segregation protein SMC n=1 Tax=Paramagnetospirillum kuznetsovii TaxID=2053833 RepID=A0A364P171_9PROT|nr:ATP-binding protein [Paramagnetospirillum kuznetsovii]RAU23071.1 chromosome segregation protein SMC [Paramagnetospirillum kuznetsovii]
MLTSVKIRNYKSIESVPLDLGRINVLIGENGAGKSNILEAIALAGAASAGKLNNEFLASRGIRVADPQLMRPAFADGTENTPIEVDLVDGSGTSYELELNNDNAPYSQWQCSFNGGSGNWIDFDKFGPALLAERAKNESIKNDLSIFINTLDSIIELNSLEETTHNDNANKTHRIDIGGDLPVFFEFLKKEAPKFTKISDHIGGFIIYSPENTSLRLFERDGQVEPLGINGEGLFKLLSVIFDGDDLQAIDSIRRGLRLFGWFKNFDVPKETSHGRRGIQVHDRFVEATNRILDQKSVNEGFLFLLFYGALFSSKLTPRFFAIDNVDASLNPKLCQHMVNYLGKLAKENGKQVIMTTHNPAVLDGLNLDDDDQRLFVVSRATSGRTKVRRIEKPRTVDGAPPVRLSEAFLRGALGGLPKGF